MQWEGEGWSSDLFDAVLSVSASMLVENRNEVVSIYSAILNCQLISQA